MTKTRSTPQGAGLTSFLSADGLKRAIVPIAAAAASLALIGLSAVSLWWLAGLAITLPIIALGLFDSLQTNATLIRNYPVAARIRWLFYDLRPYLRAYVVEGELEGKPYSIQARKLVYARARGKNAIHPFGTELDTADSSYKWITHSVAPEEDPDTRPRIVIGGPQCAQPYNASVLNISAMSFGALSANAIAALNKGAKLGGFYHDTGEGGVSPYHLGGADLVWEIGSGYFGCRDRQGRFDAGQFAETAALDAIKMTEIKLSQGAKPGHGGLLPGAKVTAEIAGIRKIPEGKDCLSPRGHSAFSTPMELLEFAARMRELSGGKPVGIKLCVGRRHEVMAIVKAMLKSEIYLDFIVVDGAEGGTGAAPIELSNHVGAPLAEGLIVVRNALVGAGIRDKIRIGASGKAYSGFSLARDFALGADWCNAARAFMFSIGCIQAMRCHRGTCPTGIATQDPGRQRGLVVDVEAERAARFHRGTVDALVEIVAAAGLKHPCELQPHHLIHRLGATGARPADEIYTFLPKGALLDSPDETIYASAWRAADPDSFHPRIDVAEERARMN
ncbi:FMN-binding glutamate synthase family protein [Pikeienuella sp. HZG-20]|uniref:FMN-binding glutamate synthase family protein n=1 Tax=Paludibacillus litoralis TaxID=3133267 RepID=UPI0030EBC70A